MDHVCNSTAAIPSVVPGPAAQRQSSSHRAPRLRSEPPWQADRKPSAGPRRHDNGWRSINTHRERLSRDAIVARIRAQVDPSLLPAPARPDADPVPDSISRLGRAVLNGMRSLMASMPTLRIGPAGADAAPSPGGATDRPAADKISSFISRFEKAFDIRKAPALAGNANLGGVAVVIGTDHSVSEDAARALTHLRPEYGDRLLVEGLSRALHWASPSCDRFNGALRASCAAIEDGCAASASYYEAMAAYQLAVHDACAFILGTLSVLRPDSEVELPRNVDECLEFSARYADLVASSRPETMQYHAMRIAQALDRFKAVDRQTRASRQAHMLEQIRRPVLPGSVRFVIVNTDFLSGLAPQLLPGDKVILMMPAATAASDVRYRMPHPMRRPGREDL